MSTPDFYSVFTQIKVAMIVWTRSTLEELSFKTVPGFRSETYVTMADITNQSPIIIEINESDIRVDNYSKNLNSS